ncbi:alpha/beta fold hydrolase [Jannaschia sp. W003]|uniref:alpha/beta fold hydrolase n=1 Tax=Jannaschia sp. W003 TaxID=2867012 RepID=UPI0021A48E7C|nr:alpha/beta hydrolase [Jannaschia sp. W003]UWQ21963.1 alpha/beta hydrolase [Jannaschia sp. W003]
MRTLVLLHGGGTDARCWEAVAPHLAGFAVRTPTLPGHGDRPAPARDRVEAIAAPVMDWIAREVPGAYALVGHSLGGMVAMVAAAEAPHRPERLVLADTFDVPAMTWRDWGRVVTLRQAARIMGHARASEAVADRAELGREGFDGTLRASMQERPALPLHRMMAAVQHFDGRPFLDRIAAPTLLLRAGGNPATAPANRRMLARLADARLEVLEGTGHLMMRDDPRGFADAVAGFLEGWQP